MLSERPMDWTLRAVTEDLFPCLFHVRVAHEI